MHILLSSGNDSRMSYDEHRCSKSINKYRDTKIAIEVRVQGHLGVRTTYRTTFRSKGIKTGSVLGCLPQDYHKS